MKHALLAVLLLIGIIHTAQAGGLITLEELADRVNLIDDRLRIVEADVSLIPGRLDEGDRRDAIQDERIEQDYDKQQDTANRLSGEVARNDVQAGRLNGHDARLDLIPALTRCMLPPLAYRHVTVRTAKGKTVTALVPTKAPLGYRPGLYWLSRINADCARRLP